MATITLRYNPRNRQLNQILNTALIAGFEIVDMKKNTKNKSFFEQPVKKQYEYFFGKKEHYTDNEIFAYNSIRNVTQILKDEL
ncbi:MAG: hypothetical protein LBG92_03960 [Prevotellaceae bacterium]|nr:hypothetical protein [Prevotellaceae bacterium]